LSGHLARWPDKVLDAYNAASGTAQSREAPKQRGGAAKPADECYAFALG
jgi:hypothetical protein